MPTPAEPAPPTVAAPVFEPGWGMCLLVAGCVVPLIFLAVIVLTDARDSDRERDALVAYASDAAAMLGSPDALNRTKPTADLTRDKREMAAAKEASDYGSFTTAPMTATALTLAGMLVAIGRRLRATGAYRALQRDPRPPVLYLRPFRADAASLTASHTLESRLLKRLWQVGPVVAIGKPGESLPPQGAARFYVDNAHWQEAVLTLMRGSRLVVMGAGRTRGFHWELAAIRDLDLPGKAVLFVPPGIAFNPELYAAFRAEAEARLRTTLPATLGRRRCLVLFDRQWRAHAVDLAAGDSSDGFAAPAKGVLAFWEVRELCRQLLQASPADAPAMEENREPVETLLRRLDEQVQRPPRFHLPVPVWLAAAAATLVFLARPAWLFPAVQPGWIGQHPGLAAIGATLFALPWITGLLGALAVYIRSPRQAVVPALGFCAAFGAGVVVCRALF